MFTIASITASFILGAVLVCNAETASQTDPMTLTDAQTADAIGDDVTATNLLRPLAQAGESVAQEMLGRLYIHSASLTRDCGAGLNWLNRAADARNAEAAFDIGALYEKGICLSRSQASSLHWYLRAAEYGYSAAANAIGEIYLHQDDSGPDNKKAFLWFLIGVKHFDRNASFHLALMYRDGLSVARSNKEAYTLFDLSVRLSPILSAERDQALMARDGVRDELMPAEVRAAESSARKLLVALLEHHEHEADLLLQIDQNTYEADSDVMP